MTCKLIWNVRFQMYSFVHAKNSHVLFSRIDDFSVCNPCGLIVSPCNPHSPSASTCPLMQTRNLRGQWRKSSYFGAPHARQECGANGCSRAAGVEDDLMCVQWAMLSAVFNLGPCNIIFVSARHYLKRYLYKCNWEDWKTRYLIVVALS